MKAWLAWTFAALFSWGIWAVLAKMLGNALTAGQSQALSTLGMLPIFVPLAWSWRRTRTEAATGRGWLLALAGGAVTCLGNVALYHAIARGEKVASVVSLTAL